MFLIFNLIFYEGVYVFIDSLRSTIEINYEKQVDLFLLFYGKKNQSSSYR